MGSLMNRSAAVAAVLLIATTAHAADAPKALYGKSILLSWVEERQQSSEAEPQPLWRRVPLTLTIYVSTAGRIFARVTASSATRTGKAEGLGLDVKTKSGGVRVARFDGRSLAVTSTFVGGARNINVDFDDAYRTCSVSVILGKSAGASKLTMPNLALGGVVEVHASRISGNTCAISDGNALGE
jgi:hypothetical protein